MAVKKTTKKVQKVVTTTTPTVSSEMAKFKAEQLRSVNIQSAVEATALSMLALLVFIGAPSVFPTVINPYDPNSLKVLQAVIAIPLAFWLLTMVGNMVRTVKIQKLLKNLK